MADAKNPPAAKAAAPKMVPMHRAVHELRTGPDDKDGLEAASRIEAGTIITDEVAAEHDLDGDTIAKLVKTGAIDFVDVLKG